MSAELIMLILTKRDDGCNIEYEGGEVRLVSNGEFAKGTIVDKVDIASMSAKEILDWIADRQDY